MTSWKDNNVLESKKLTEETLNSAKKSVVRTEEALENEIKEDKIVNYREYYRKLEDFVKKYSTSNITIENKANEFNDEPVNVSVSGRIFNATSLEEVEGFVLALRRAAKACENFEYNGFIINWD